MIAALMDDDEQKKKEIIMMYNKKEEYIANTVINNQRCQVSYGLMAYNTYYLRGQLLSNYKIWQTSTDINIMIAYIKTQMIRLIKNNIIANLLFYIVDTNPGAVSYHYITSSNYKFIHIIINNTNKLCYIYGDKTLHEKLYEQLYFLKEYNTYKNKIKNLSKNELKNLHYESYGTIPLLMTKNSIYCRLLKHKKYLIINN